MSEAKFTRGKWWVNHVGPHHNNPDIAQHEICYSEDAECVVDHVYELADAHLIAAAPEMYEMLESLTEMSSEDAKLFIERGSAIADLLAKARGELCKD